jgi:hypothetical protein
VKIAKLHKVNYRFSAISFKILMLFFNKIEKSTQKSTWKHKSPRQAKQSRAKRATHNAWLQIILHNYIVMKNSMILAQQEHIPLE